jgi:hypothetical protein
MARESPGSGDGLSPGGRRGWGDSTVKEDDVALKNDRIYRTEFRQPGGRVVVFLAIYASGDLIYPYRAATTTGPQ